LTISNDENASIDKVEAGGSECLGVRVVFRGMVEEVTKGGEEAEGVVECILGVTLAKFSLWDSFEGSQFSAGLNCTVGGPEDQGH
jgi:hypothetical protein